MLIDSPEYPIYKTAVLRPNNIFLSNWKVIECTPTRSQAQLDNEVNLSKNHIKTNFSKKSRQNLCTALHWLEAGATWQRLWNPDEEKEYFFKTNLITLTVPSSFGDILTREEAEKLREYDAKGNLIKISDFELKEMEKVIVSRVTFQKCLNHWLTVMRRKFKLHNYVWKVELQRNGQLHIHINTDTFIKHQDILFTWNHILNLNGLLDNYKKSHAGRYPNSTDVHSIKNSWSSVGYIAKYMLKDPNLGNIYNGRVWGCSTKLAPKHKIKVKLEQPDMSELRKELIKNNIEYKTIELINPKDNSTFKIGTLFFLDNKDWKKFTSIKVSNAFKKHVTYLKSNREKMNSEYYQTNLFNKSLKDSCVDTSIDIPDIPAIEKNIFVPSQLALNF